MAGGLGNIGAAFVTVELDFARARQQIEAESGTQNLNVDVEADTTAARREIESLDDEKVTVEVDGDLDPLRDEFGRFRKREAPREGRGSGLEFGRGFLKQIKRIDFGAGILDTIKPAAFIAGVGLAAQAASAAAAGILALSGSIAQLSGALVALPAVAIAAGQAMSVFSLATTGVGDALGGLNEKADPEKIKALTPPAQAFVKALDALKPRIRDFQTSLQGALFPGLLDGVRNLTPLLAALQAPLRGTADALGDLASNGSAAVASMIGPITTLAEFNNDLIRSLGATGIVLTRSLVDVLITARPLIRFMARSLNVLATSLGENIRAGIATGGLAEFFRQTRIALVQVSRLTGSLGRILGAIFGAATPFGNELLTILNQQADTLADFLGTAQGQNTLRKFFEDAMPSIKALGRLVVVLSGAFFELARLPGLTKAIDGLTGLIPPITDLIAVTTENLVPVLIPALENIILLLGDFTGSTGGLVKLVEVLGGIAGGLHDFFKDHKTILKFANELVFALGLMSALGLGSFISSMTGIGRGIGLVLKVVRPIIKPLGSLFRILSSAGGPLEFLSVSVAGIADAIIAIGGAIGTALASPIVAFTLAIVGTAGAFLLAYNNSKLFRQAAQFVSDAFVAMFPPIKFVLERLSDFVLALFGIGNNATTFRERLRVAFAGVSAAGAKLLASVRGFFAQLGAVFRLVVNTGRALFASLGNAFRVVQNTVSAVVASVRAAFGRFLDSIRSLVTNAIATFGRFRIRIQEILSNIDLAGIGRRIMGGLLTGLEDGFDKVKDFVSKIAGIIKKLKGPISVDRKLLVDEGRAIMGGFNKGLHQRWGGIRKWLSSIGGFFKGAIGGQSLDVDIANILLGKGTIDDLNQNLGSQLGIPADLIGSGLTAFLHPSSGWADTTAQSKLLEKIFHVGRTPGAGGLRPPGTHTASGSISQHSTGHAQDFGTAYATFGALNKLAKFTSTLVDRVFKQVIWQNSLWRGGTGGHGFIGEHMDHVHLGWVPRAAGGQARKDGRYQWNERGAEMFVPHQSGYVMNAGRTKEFISAIKSLSAQRPSSNTRNAEIHVHSNAADPAAVGGILMTNLAGAFSRA